MSAVAVEIVEREVGIHREEYSGPLTIAVVGATSAVMARFYQDPLIDLTHCYPGLNVLPIYNNRPPVDDLGLPLAEAGWIQMADFMKAVKASDQGVTSLNGSETRVDGVMLGTPTDTHYPLAKAILESLKCPVLVEKPLCLTEELESMRRLYETHPSKFVAADFFLGSAALQKFRQEWGSISGRVGEITAISCEMAEQNGVELGREWLLGSRNGGGMGMDMSVHNVAAYNVIFGLAGINPTLDLTDVQMAQYLRDGQALGVEGETFIRIKGRAQGRSGLVEVAIQGGKGLPNHYYGMTGKCERGSFEIFFGTDGADAYDPYLLVRGRDGGLLRGWTFPCQGVGYYDLLRDFLRVASGQNPVDYNLAGRFEASYSAVKVVTDAYRWHESLGRRMSYIPFGTLPQGFSSMHSAPSIS